MNNTTQQNKLLYPKILWQRPVHKYKSSAGRVMILAGSKNMSGVAILACETVFRSGTGILILGFPESLRNTYKGILPDAMTLALPETPGGTLAKKANTLILEHVESCDVAIIGPGLSGNAETTQLIWELIFNISKPVVLDTDAINALIIGVSVMRKRESLDFLIDYFAGRPNELILTLDVGDLFKLISAVNIDKKFTIKYVQEHPQEVLEIVTRALSCTTVLNVREPMIITCTGITIITPSTASDEPTGASGDALSGIIGSFVAQNPGKHLEAIATAVYLYVKTKEFALEKKDKEVILPSDIVRYLPGIIKDIENE